MSDRLRRLVARLVDRIPGTCGYTTWRWANRRDVRWPIARAASQDCRALAVRHGWCPCARITDGMEWFDNGGAGGLL